MTATAVRRDTAVDRLRGLAIALMVLDHTLLCAIGVWGVSERVEGIASLVRITLTRLALPLFMVLSGWLLARKDLALRRYFQVLAVGLASTAVAAAFALPIATPDVLIVWCVVMTGSALIRRFPVQAVAVGVVQSFTWPWPWDGYQPGVVLALVAAGVLAKHSNSRFYVIGDRLPRLLEVVGRHPLGWYFWHLVALGCVTVVVVGL